MDGGIFFRQYPVNYFNQVPVEKKTKPAKKNPQSPVIRIIFPAGSRSRLRFSARVRLRISRAVLPAVTRFCLARDLRMGVVQGMGIVGGSPASFCGWARVPLIREVVHLEIMGRRAVWF